MGESAGQPPRLPARLQPEEHHELSQPSFEVQVIADALAETERLAREEQGANPELQDAVLAQERLQRRMADARLVESLKETEFDQDSVWYQMFVSDLAAYGYPVMLSWLRRRVVFSLCAARGRPVRYSDHDLQVLEEAYEERLELALETVAEGLKFFRTHALVQGKWSVDKGASLKTYFMGACLLCFPNVYRRWASEKAKWSAISQRWDITDEEGRHLAGEQQDTAQEALDQIAISDQLEAMPEGTRDVAALVLEGYTHSEIAHKLQITERAVEGRLYRYRKSATRHLRERGEHG